ncbi:MAG: glycine dehydrogenase [Flavobacteriaceae bacterium]|jgi:hypothetical protein|nr:glycine dehydrogenase [Flavobacteriaceae bacterium]
MKCEEAVHVCDKSQYKEASFWERLKLNIHLLYCSVCRAYTKNNIKLSNVFKKSNIKTMSLNDKKDLKETIHQEIAK